MVESSARLAYGAAMKHAIWLVLVGLFVTTGCDSENKPESTAAASASATKKDDAKKDGDKKGDKSASSGTACEEWAAALKKCSTQNEAVFKPQLKMHEKAWAVASDAAKKQMEQSCATGLATLKQSGQCKL